MRWEEIRGAPRIILKFFNGSTGIYIKEFYNIPFCIYSIDIFILFFLARNILKDKQLKFFFFRV